MAELSELASIIEGVLFVADEPVEVRALSRLLDQKPAVIEEALDELAAASAGRGVRVQRTGSAAQMVNSPESTPYVQRYLRLDEKQRISPAVLATLTVIAYKQPVTKSQVEKILRKNCDYGIMVLKARELIAEVGREKGPGLPYLYGTTFKFLEHFGLETPRDLPPLPELETAEPATNGHGPSDEATDTGDALTEAEAPGA
jgi:segregation and condensation protein B